MLPSIRGAGSGRHAVDCVTECGTVAGVGGSGRSLCPVTVARTEVYRNTDYFSTDFLSNEDSTLKST